MTGKDRISLAAVVAMLAAGSGLTPLTTDRTYLLLALILMLTSAGIGAAARRLTENELAVRIAQLMPAGLLLWLVPATREPIELIDETVGFVQESVAPMEFHIGFAVFCVVLLWLLYLVVESMTAGLATPAWTFPALFTPYLITAFVGYLEAAPWLFLLPAAGYALLLATDTRNRTEADSGDHEPTGPERMAAESWRSGVARAALVASVAALVGTIVAGLAIPERYRDWAAPSGPGAVQLGDPSLDLIRNLNSTSDKPVITYRTSSESGEYLRLAALPVLDDTGFHLSATDLVGLPLRNDISEDLYSDRSRTEIEVGEFASEYLPVPWTPLNVAVAGEWRYDPRTLAVVAVGDNRRTASRKTSYSVVSARMFSLDELLPQLAEAGSVGDDGVSLNVPEGISPEVVELTRVLFGGTTTAGERAIAIRDHLRSDEYTYSTVAMPGTTMETLNDFLVGRRVGYCEQFAGGMAVLSRMAGIPSRVVIGFLPGKKDGEQWQVSPRNMHAWAELYFDDVGWVAVDATPPGAVAGNGTPSATPSAKPSPTTTKPSAATASPSATAKPTAPGGFGLPLVWFGWTALGLAAAALAGIGPGLTRRIIRSRRLRDPGLPFESAWEELEALAKDRRIPWPAGSSRAVATELGPELAEPVRADFERLALDVQRSRYSAEPVPVAELTARVERIEAAMKKRWTEPTAWLDRWWPRSLRPW